MVTLTSVADIHSWRPIDDESAPEGILVELVEDQSGTFLRAEPSVRGIFYRSGGWIREDGSSFQNERLVYWRHFIPELTQRFKEQKLLSPDTTLEDFCIAWKANDSERNKVRAQLKQEEL